MTLWLPIGVLLLLIAAAALAADFFFRYTFTRAPKPDPWAPAERDMILKDRAFFEREDRVPRSIQSPDGLTLRAWFYDRGARDTVILCHGYRGGPEELSGIASRLYALGWNILLIYERAHGLSDGAFFTMGAREKQDIAAWARDTAERQPEGKIVLFGWSMGGNSVMGAVGEPLPANVAGAVEDCGYADLAEQLLFSCRSSMPRLPAKRLMIRLLGLYCRLFRGFVIHEPRGEALARCRVPMLFIHGSCDKVVPYENLDLCYTACAAKKLRSSYAGAPHVGSCGSDPQRYFDELSAFLSACTGRDAAQP